MPRMQTQTLNISKCNNELVMIQEAAMTLNELGIPFDNNLRFNSTNNLRLGLYLNGKTK